MLITIIGRGHGGTRAMSHTLTASGVWMGDTLNGSGDLLPPEPMYEACRVLARHVQWKGGLEWDFSKLHTMPIPQEFRGLIETYLQSVLPDEPAPGGWKIPETTLVYPWIVRMFPEIRYIFWSRDPRDSIAGAHLTDDLERFGIQAPPTEDVYLRRAISWKYQYDIVRATPRPAHGIEVRFEDFVLRQEETLGRLEKFLGIPLGRIVVRPDSVGRWRRAQEVHGFDFLEPAMREYGYELPAPGGRASGRAEEHERGSAGASPSKPPGPAAVACHPERSPAVRAERSAAGRSEGSSRQPGNDPSLRSG